MIPFFNYQQHMYATVYLGAIYDADASIPQLIK